LDCEFNGAICVIPIEVNTTEDFAFFVDGDIIMFAQGMDKMGGMGVANNFNTEIIDKEVKVCWLCDMTKESWCVSSLSGPLRRWRYSLSLPVSALRIALA
jgi:hypothetical protein